MDIAALKVEIDAGHPDTGAYSLDNATAAAELNAVNRDLNRVSMTGSEVLNNVDAAEWTALAAGDKQTVWDIVHLGVLNPFGVEATLMTNVFGGGSATITALAAARRDDVSRADELRLGFVFPAHVSQARAYHG